MSDQCVYALILSGGSGARFGNEMPKQFADVYGKTILDYCLTNFNSHNRINKIIVVSNPEHIQRTKQIAMGGKFAKVVSVIEGGATRGESSFLGVKEILKHESKIEKVKVLIQDAARPNTTADIITEVIQNLENHNAVTVAIPTTDTIYISNSSGTLESIPDRSKIYKAQTPQGFSLESIAKAYESLEKVHRFKQTDDSSIFNMVFPNETIKIVNGDNNNIKITFSEDLEFFRQILKNKK
ncbi:MAG: 2-C-methyl-D-erythritol 4-phosphate cytidylyltransferase [Bacteroidales bacterium]|nr:2-C-methyl-D-erythritol 4-phosphate cytidylyltransferase [Bacteroidales bacterium]